MLNFQKDPCCDVIVFPVMQNITWFYCCRVLTVVLEPVQDTVFKHTLLLVFARGFSSEYRCAK